LSRLANLAIAHGAMASRLVTEERTRTIHPDGRRENVSEHSHMLTKVATAIAAEFYPWLDREKVANYGSLHDDVEAYVKDMATDSLAGHDPGVKKLREAYGMKVLSAEYQESSPHYVQMLQAYEKQEELEAQFVRIVDKMMVLLIHIPNEGEVLRANYSYEEMLQNSLKVEQTLLEQYPQWIELIEKRTSFSDHLADIYVKNWNGWIQDRLPLA
jgi:5'-deoxynucleotidase YfbR-like HD superfamily hydrolase